MKYTIMHIDDRAKKQIYRNKKNLKGFEYIDDIKFFNGNLYNAKDIIFLAKKYSLNVDFNVIKSNAKWSNTI